MEKRQEIKFDLAIFEVVEHLVGGAVAAVLNREQFFHIIDVKVRNSPAFDFSGCAKFLECLYCLFERRRPLSPVQKTKIDRFDAETFEAALARFGQLCVR